MDDDVRQAIMTRLTVEVWPIAGKALNYKTKSASYAAARRGVIVTVEGQGRRRTVPTAWLRRVLLIDGGEAAETRSSGPRVSAIRNARC